MNSDLNESTIFTVDVVYVLKYTHKRNIYLREEYCFIVVTYAIKFSEVADICIERYITERLV